MSLLSKQKSQALHRKLELFYEDFVDPSKLAGDPLGAMDRYSYPPDLEILSFIIAGLSYGRVEQVLRSYDSACERLKELGLGPRGEGIAALLTSESPELLFFEAKRAFSDWRHRLNTSEDIAELLKCLATVLRKYGSLENAFRASDNKSFEAQLVDFHSALSAGLSARSRFKIKNARSGKSRWKGTGASWFFNSPESGGTCKRLLMWLRWMVRDDCIDLGLWEPEGLLEQLHWPVDVHIHRWALAEGLSSRTSINWAFTKELSQLAKEINSSDPLKYDFAICQAGMLAFRGKL